MPATKSPQLTKVTFPAIGAPKEPRPELTERIFAARLKRVRQRMAEQKFDAMLVYGDKEHFGSLAWLTNYDPRFEEALLVVLPKGTPVLLVGNEGMVYSKIAKLPVKRLLYQTFSLLGQPREKVKPLNQVLKGLGLGQCKNVGVAGWKYFTNREVNSALTTLDVPDFIAQGIRGATRGRVTNQTAQFMDPENGLRMIFEAEQLADFEWLTTYNSHCLMRGLRGLRPGLTEMEAFANLRYPGLALGYHAICSSGERFPTFLASPTSNVIKRGEPFFMTLSIAGTNTCRFGWIARGPGDLSPKVRNYAEKTASPYFGALKAWYETLAIGATGHALHHAVRDRLIPLGFNLGLNCGHLSGMDEWTHSFVAEKSKQRVQSGQYWQVDFFATRDTPHLGAFAEDGVVVADAALRQRLAKDFPQAWSRIQKRRKFMAEQLGIHLAEEVLPISNFPATVMPYLLNPDRCMSAR